MKVQISGHRTSIQPRWKDHIYERLAKLERFEDKIIKLDYTLTSSHHHMKGEELCRITAKVPRKTISVKKTGETMIGAIDAASYVLERQIQQLWKDVKDRNRHKVQARRVKRGEGIEV